MKLLHVVGARPNFMKLAPVWKALADTDAIEQEIVHTGQHYDVNMSDVFFTELKLDAPHYNLGVGSGTHAEQTAAVMVGIERLLLTTKPDKVVIYGDVNSTIAAALVCSKLMIPVTHVEAGLRSFDRTMPEEINRILTDQISDILLTPSQDANSNLSHEGISESRVHFVGNVMIDTLVSLLPAIDRSDLLDRLNIENQPYIAMTLHRPFNVDDPERLLDIMNRVVRVSQTIPFIFPVHPRTASRLEAFSGQLPKLVNVRMVEPLGYLDFMKLVKESTAVLTDSGGIQEETSYLGIPCLTVRPNTERPITTTMGTNTLVGDNLDLMTSMLIAASEQDSSKHAPHIPLWDGHASERIAKIIAGI